MLIIGFGKIGTRSAKRFAAMETHVLVYDPYMYSETIRGMGVAAVENILSILDGKPIRDNVVNKEVLD